MKVLHIIPNLEYGDAARQLTLLVPALVASDIECWIAVMSGIGPLAKPLQSADLSLEFLNWKRWVDPQPFWRLRQILKAFRPTIIHCWRHDSIRALVLTGWCNQGACVIGSLRGRPGNGILSKLESKLYHRMDRLVFQWSSDIDHWKTIIPEERLSRISPGIHAFEPTAIQADFDLKVKRPPEGRVILCIGPLETSKGILEAIWAFHILGYLFANLYLVIVGEGPDHERLSRLGKNVFPGRLIFLGARPDWSDILARAEVVWVPSLKARGFNVALEAMAAGKPIVASRLPGLTEIIVDGQTGFFIEPGDKVGLARQTRLLLDDPEKGRRMGEAGRRRAAEKFSVEALAHAYENLYKSISNST